MNRRRKQKEKFLAKAKQKELTTLEQIVGMLTLKAEVGHVLATQGMLTNRSDWSVFHGINEVVKDVTRMIGDSVITNKVDYHINEFRKYYYTWKEQP